jgi:uncharacterized protein (DUF697 family)/predicted GTPase
VSSEKLDEILVKAKERLPPPVIWLLGKTLAGKTSIIKEITQSDRAEIGSGLRPCTRFSQIYEFPNATECIVKLLDTRGLGEVDYDPAEDLAVAAGQSHVLLVVVRAMDHALADVVTAVEQVKRQRPDFPVIVVHTALHEGYLAGTGHVLPYPFGQTPLPASVSVELQRSLAAQRELFADVTQSFVAVDFTLPQDGFAPVDYGLESLWTAIEQVLPTGLRGMLAADADLPPQLRNAYYRTAHPHVVAYAVAAGLAGSVPVPLVDMPVFLAIQAKMFHSVASIYNQSLDARTFADFGGALGVSFAARMAGRQLLKFVPVLGWAASGLFNAATTYALGCTLCMYCASVKAGHIPSAEEIRKMYAEQFKRGEATLKEYLQQREAK